MEMFRYNRDDARQVELSGNISIVLKSNNDMQVYNGWNTALRARAELTLVGCGRANRIYASLIAEFDYKLVYTKVNVPTV